MPRQNVNLGTAPEGTGGDTARGAFTKINEMTTELYATDASLDARVTAIENEPTTGVTSVAGVSPDGTGNVDAAQLRTALNVPQFEDLDDKVDKVAGKQLSDENYTLAEKQRLAALPDDHFRGTFATFAALVAAVPTANAGDYADVDGGVGQDVTRFIWDETDGQWLPMGSGSAITAAQVKTLYESNPDTNAYTDAEKTKLGGIAAGATVNSTDAFLRDRANHTGTQTSSTISDLAAAVRTVVLTGLTAGTNVAIAATDSVLTAFGKLQAQINAKLTNVMTDVGDLIIGGAAGVATRLARGASGQVLTSNGTTVVWADPTGGSSAFLTPQPTAAATANGQTAFSLTHTAGAGFLVFNGSVLRTDAYTEDGTGFVLLDGSNVKIGTRLYWFGFGTFNVANALPVGGTAADSAKLNGQNAAFYATAADLAAVPEQKLFVTPDQVISNTRINVTVTGMATIQDYEIFLRCVTAENGFAVGAITKPQDYEYSGTAAYGVTGTFVGLTFTFLVGPLATLSNAATPGGVAITPANWRLFARIKGV